MLSYHVAYLFSNFHVQKLQVKKLIDNTGEQICMVFIAMSTESEELNPKSENEFPIIAHFREVKMSHLMLLRFSAP